MIDIEFSKEETAILVQKVKQYFDTELRQEIGQFDAEFLLAFLGRELGVYFYNRGLNDAQCVLNSRFEELMEAIYVLEKPTEFSK